MGKNRHAYTDARGDLIYYSSKEGKTGSGSKYCKQIAKTLPKKDKKRNRVKKND
tara:strand:+ start:942 stop:1103 length:162 start_codon:yes stop_codon:yes gene_type:complete